MLDQLAQAARSAVLNGGARMKATVGQRMTVQYKTSWSDLVTEVDKAVEEAVAGEIRQRFPDHGFLGEEGGGDWSQEYTWVLDPLDGTTNFAHTLPNFVCALACYRGSEGQVAAIYDPNRDELFEAIRGRGAFLNGTPIRVDEADQLQQSLIGTNLMWDMREERFSGLPGLQSLSRSVRGIRSLGAAALEQCYVACGRLTGFMQYRLAPWDFAAGALIIAEAGGTVTQIDGSPLDITRACSVVATNGLIHPEVLQHLKQK